MRKKLFKTITGGSWTDVPYRFSKFKSGIRYFYRIDNYIVVYAPNTNYGKELTYRKLPDINISYAPEVTREEVKMHMRKYNTKLGSLL